MDNHLRIEIYGGRDLTAEERIWIEKLMSIDFKGREVLLQQLKTARVVSMCGCGCKTVDIQVDKACDKFYSATRLPLEMTAKMSDNIPVVFYLHVMDGYVVELEVFRADSSPVLEKIDLTSAIVHVNEE